MAYLSLTDADQQAHIAAAIVSREQEVFFYQLNIANYRASLATMPQGEWPANIIQYKGWSHEQLASVDEPTHLAVAEYMHRDRVAFLVRTEQIECAKSQAVLTSMLAQIPADQHVALVAAAKAKVPVA